VVEAGLLQGISLSSKERFQFEGPVILNPHTSACDVRAVAATSSLMPRVLRSHMRRRRNMEHAIPLSGPSSHILLTSLCRLCISTIFWQLLSSGHVWLAGLAVCRPNVQPPRILAWDSWAESQKRGTSSVGPCAVAYGQKREPYGLPA
jgi:hypothetical protein